MLKKGLGGLCLLFWFTVILYLNTRQHFCIFLMFLTIDDMEVKRLCNTLYLNNIVINIIQMMLGDIPVKHCREKSAAIFLNRHFLPLRWH